MFTRTIAGALLATALLVTPASAAYEEDLASLVDISAIGANIGKHMTLLVGPELYDALNADLVDLRLVETTRCTQPYADYVASLGYLARSSSLALDVGQPLLAVELLTIGSDLVEIDYDAFWEACQ